MLMEFVIFMAFSIQFSAPENPSMHPVNDALQLADAPLAQVYDDLVVLTLLMTTSNTLIQLPEVGIDMRNSQVQSCSNHVGRTIQLVHLLHVVVHRDSLTIDDSTSISLPTIKLLPRY